MSSKIQFSILLMTALFLGGCAWTPHSVDLQPQVSMTGSAVGAGTRLYMRFIDERDDMVIGHRAVGQNGAKITAEQLPGLVEAQLREGETKKGYMLVPSQEGSDAIVTFRLRSFKLGIEQGFWSGGQNVAATLSVDARRTSKDYSNVYRHESEKRIQVVPDGHEIDQVMTAALSEILSKTLSDSNLDLFLTGKSMTSDSDSIRDTPRVAPTLTSGAPHSSS
jgi:uncharacterized lipoprotein